METWKLGEAMKTLRPWTTGLRKLRFWAGLVLMAATLSGTVQAGVGPPPGVPEIDPGSACCAVTFLTGALMVMADRRHPH
jgi:hypothetical protein